MRVTPPDSDEPFSVEVRGFEPLTPCMPSAQDVFQRTPWNSEYMQYKENARTGFVKIHDSAREVLKELLTDSESGSCKGSPTCIGMGPRVAGTPQ